MHRSNSRIHNLQVPEVPPELQEWTQNTAVAGMAGILYAGGREYLAIRRLGKIFVPLTFAG